MTAALLTGAGVGLGAWVLWAALWPARPPLAVAVAPLHTDPAPAEQTRPADGWRERVGGPLAKLLHDTGVPLDRVRADLAVTGRSLQWLCAEKVAAALVALLLLPATMAMLALVGLRLPLIVPVWATVLAAAGAFVAPDLQLRKDAEARRRSFRHAVGAYLDLVSISLAGGAAAEEALRNALADGDGWAFARLRATVAAAQLAGEPPWKALGRLGRQLDVRELGELASSLALAGVEGATVRRSLAAKAVATRAHQLAEAETRAATVTDRMVLPLMLLLLGFVAFIGYPAFTRAIAGF